MSACQNAILRLVLPHMSTLEHQKLSWMDSMDTNDEQLGAPTSGPDSRHLTRARYRERL